MSPNQILVRNMFLVMCVIVAITTIALWLGRPDGGRHEPVTIERAGSGATRDTLGAKLYERKGCVTCHSVDGSPRVGPTFLHDFGSTITLDGGVTIRVDEAYIRESLLRPQSKARPGYPPSMPSYDGLLKEREIEALIAYLESLR